MKKSIPVMASLIMVLLLSSSASASFDFRSGFHGGYSFGIAPILKTDRTFDSETAEFGGIGVTLGGTFGYGLGQQDFLTIDVRFSTSLNDDHWQGMLRSLVLYHYWSDETNSWFNSFGIGSNLFYTNHSITQRGSSWIAGAGYQFDPEWEIGLYYSFGGWEEPYYDFDQKALNLLLTWMRY